MELNKVYFHDALGLKTEVRDLAEKIESAVEMRIEFIYSPDTFLKLVGSGCQATAACWVSECQAAIICRVPEISQRTFFHELLHVKQAWIDRGVRLRRSSGKPLGLLEGYQNDLEHLLIIPQERVLFDTEGDRAHWVREYGDPTTRLHPAPSFQRIRLFMGWLLARELLTTNELVGWQAVLGEQRLFDAANAFADDVVNSLPNLRTAWLTIFDWLDLRWPDLQWKTLDPLNRTVLLSELPPPD